jgi:hypothetical protein
VPPKVPEADSQAIISAIEDEVYDYRLQEKFRDVGKPLGTDKFQIPVYVLPGPKGKGHDYYLIYRLMPYGELYRLVSVREDGSLAGLLRNPKLGFPPDASATPTLYYDDDEICNDKHKAAKFFFVVDLGPPKERIREAVERQKKRYGFSELEREQAESLDLKDGTLHPQIPVVASSKPKQ